MVRETEGESPLKEVLEEARLVRPDLSRSQLRARQRLMISAARLENSVKSPLEAARSFAENVDLTKAAAVAAVAGFAVGYSPAVREALKSGLATALDQLI